MYLLLGLMFAVIYALVVVVGVFVGIANFFLFGVVAAFLVLLQYAIGPKAVEISMGVRYVSEKEEPALHKMVEELARKAGIKKPRVGISELRIPNAFAFGRSRGDGRVCVTRGIMELLDEDELRAVLGHEISHIAHRDVMVITMLSVIPMICWYLSWNFMFSSGRERGNLALIGLFAFILYFITNLLVLYASRIREYYADRGSVKLGNEPHSLASALYKLVYRTARAGRNELKRMEGYKAFFLNDPSKAAKEFSELRSLDKDLSGKIEKHELETVRESKIKLGFADRLMEMWSTHPNMLKRIKYLSGLG